MGYWQVAIAEQDAKALLTTYNVKRKSQGLHRRAAISSRRSKDNAKHHHRMMEVVRSLSVLNAKLGNITG